MVKRAKTSDRSGQVRISRIATFANWCITTVTAVIALGFVGLALKDIPITALSNANPEIIQVAILSVYISCWAYGTSIDTKIRVEYMRTTHREDVSGPDQLLLWPFSRLFQSFCCP